MARQYSAERSIVRQYAQIIGVIVVVVGVVGLLLGDARRLIVFNIDLVEDIVHLATGGLMAYVGFAGRDNALARSVVGGLGVVYLLVGILGFIVPTLFGLLPHGYNIWDNLLHLALGVLGITVAWFVGRAGISRSA
jgi:hypothetical protein